MGGTCIIDSLFSRLASVGDTVRAPRPDARPEAMLCRLLPDELGVCARFGLPLDAGLPLGVFGSWSLGGGCRLLTFACLLAVVAVSVDIRGSSAPADAEGWMVVRLALVRLLCLAKLGWLTSEGVVGICSLLFLCLSIMLVISPGPTLFLGGLAAPVAAGGGCILPAGACGIVL